jgi:alcohol dehydrogenase, propanol-preferring
MEELMELAISKTIEPQIEVYDFPEISAIIEKLKKDEVSGRIVVRIPQA